MIIFLLLSVNTNKTVCISKINNYFIFKNIQKFKKLDLIISKDYLLCHDDELEGRRIAFILYLVPVWTQSDGGLLQMFDCNRKSELILELILS
jgi:Rps23 Pro-64 3,4-dihydroxylase Tpa1-like proline 4-hydroxylase